MNTKIIIGIDPGVSGGIAILYPSVPAPHKLALWPMPENEEKQLDLVKMISDIHPTAIFIEKIPKYIFRANMSHESIPGSALAMLYGNYKFLVGTCMALGNKPVPLAPVVWQYLLGYKNTEKLVYTEWKKKLKQKADEVFGKNIIIPTLKGCTGSLTMKTCDAALIALAGEKWLDTPDKKHYDY